MLIIEKSTNSLFLVIKGNFLNEHLMFASEHIVQVQVLIDANFIEINLTV